ncbi:hypothetical protein FHS24_000651 [Psychrobacter luti]|uniref:Uncharacterized protein n=1 Tax=Psychrobacter luti TaxID=198481 RepID=A0A839TB51_9GAMM|nr:hypothetical protein [Psychrobacter luti]MBB3106160.1 hypothetical protein [Psychrobacter luti]
MKAYEELARVIIFQVLGARYLVKTGYTAVVAIISIVNIVRIIDGIDSGNSGDKLILKLFGA